MMTWTRTVSLARISSRWAMSFAVSAISASSLSRSKPANLLEVGDELRGLGDLRLQLVAFQARQLGQAHVQNFLGLDGRQVEAFHQAGLGRLGVLRRANQVD